MSSKTPPFFVLTGPPGSGKTTVLTALCDRVNTVSEPARRVLSEQRRIGGTATGDQDPSQFVAHMLSLAASDIASAEGATLFDRGLPDLLGFTTHYELDATAVLEAVAMYRYRSPVFFLPSWEAIYENDDERTLSFEGSAAFGDLIRQAYEKTGYEILMVPKLSPKHRADFILEQMTL